MIDNPDNGDSEDRENLIVDLLVSTNDHSWKKTITLVYANAGSSGSAVTHLGFKGHYLAISY